MQGALHPSLRAYIECWLSPPFPKSWPRGGGIWDQSPMLVRDFRTIKDFEIQWKNAQREINERQGGQPNVEGGETGLESALDAYIDSLEEGDTF